MVQICSKEIPNLVNNVHTADERQHTCKIYSAFPVPRTQKRARRQVPLHSAYYQQDHDPLHS
jgi:hypothetical protein